METFFYDKVAKIASVDLKLQKLKDGSSLHKFRQLTKLNHLDDLEYCVNRLLELEKAPEDKLNQEEKELKKKFEFQVEEWLDERIKEEFDKKDIEIAVEILEDLIPILEKETVDQYQKRAYKLPKIDNFSDLIKILKRLKKLDKIKYVSLGEKEDIKKNLIIQMNEWFYIAENQINQDSLKKSIDSSAEVNSKFFLYFMGALIFLAISTGSVSDTMLLLNTPFELPVLKISIPLFGYFLLMPMALIALHINLLFNFSQHLIKLRRYFFITQSKRETEEMVVHPFLLNFTEVESIGWFSRTILRLLNSTLLFVLPILQLLWVQLVFSKYQDMFLINWHFGCLLLDMTILYIYWQKIQSDNDKESMYYFHFKSGFFSVIGKPFFFVRSLIRKVSLKENCKQILAHFFQFASSAFLVCILTASTINVYYVYQFLKVDQEILDIKSYRFHSYKFLFPRLNIENQEFKGLNLEDRNFVYANFFRVKFENVSFKFTNLRGSSFILCDTEKANFYLSKMEGIKPTGMKLESEINEENILK